MSLTLDQALSQLDVSASSFNKIDVVGHWSPPPAMQGQVHLIIVLSGEGKMLVDDRSMPVVEGQLLVICGEDRPVIVLGATPTHNLNIAYGVVDATLLDGRNIFELTAMPLTFDAGRSELFTGAIPEMLREAKSGGAGSKGIVICLVRRIVTRVLRDAWAPEIIVTSNKDLMQRQRLADAVESMRKDLLARTHWRVWPVPPE